MIASTRRRFLAQSASLLALGASGLGGGAALAAMGPNDKFDLLVKGGDVLDPSQNLRGRRDIGIRWGIIEAVEPDIPAERALKVLNVGGKLVTPGLVDLHAHVYPYGSAIGIPADELLTFQATTTMVSAGDAGANNFAAFRRYVVGQTRTRLYAFVHIANIGLTPFPVAELYNIDYARGGRLRQGGRGELRHRHRCQGPHVGKRHRQERHRAAASVDRGGDQGRRRRQGDVPHRRGRDAQADVGHSRHAAPRRHPDACLFRLAQQRRRLHQHHPGRPALAGGERREATRRRLRRRPWRRQLRLHGGRGGDCGRGDPRHHLLRHPRVLRQHAGHALSHLGDEQVPQHGILPGAGGGDGHRQSRRESSTGFPSSALCRSARPATCRCWNWSKVRSSSSIPATTSARARCNCGQPTWC